MLELKIYKKETLFYNNSCLTIQEASFVSYCTQHECYTCIKLQNAAGSLEYVHVSHGGCLASLGYVQGSIVIQQVSNFNIKCIKWSPFEDNKLLSCGRDCIRMYRLKGDKLRGMSIKLGPPDKRVQFLVP